MELGDRIAAWREVRGLNQKQLAEKAGCSRAAISQLESGRKKKTPKKSVKASPSMNMLNAIAAALGCSLEQFFGRIPKSKKAAA